MEAGSRAVGGKYMVLGVALHAAAYAGREFAVVAYGVGAVAGLLLAYGCGTYLGGKGYPRFLGLPAFALSVVWIGVCLLVPDREDPHLPPPQRPARSE